MEYFFSCYKLPIYSYTTASQVTAPNKMADDYIIINYESTPVRVIQKAELNWCEIELESIQSEQYICQFHFKSVTARYGYRGSPDSISEQLKNRINDLKTPFFLTESDRESLYISYSYYIIFMEEYFSHFYFIEAKKLFKKGDISGGISQIDMHERLRTHLHKISECACVC